MQRKSVLAATQEEDGFEGEVGFMSCSENEKEYDEYVFDLHQDDKFNEEITRKVEDSDEDTVNSWKKRMHRRKDVLQHKKKRNVQRRGYLWTKWF
ncbi:hypothetical protein NDU88_001439 [Pleurodeles waltl]|uniref:Uncharacterized protein n=1 Tax=Pleurodeles waltl TaxID=8319 RepID=A0AAV7UST0_PLEWA|nr:hypothetical protein NDU88_001439 [Pleurodeles waltl]